jgi:hypothetical protein
VLGLLLSDNVKPLGGCGAGTGAGIGMGGGRYASFCAMPPPRPVWGPRTGASSNAALGIRLLRLPPCLGGLAPVDDAAPADGPALAEGL